MKLTEAQIANLYQKNSNHTLEAAEIDTFFSSSDASSSRIQSADHILNNHDASMAFQATGLFKEWTQQIADTVMKKSQSSFSIFGFNFKPVLTASAMALVVISSVSLMNSNGPTLQHNSPMQSTMIGNVVTDSISNNSFDTVSDSISSGSFDEAKIDSLFNSSFG